MKFFQKISNWRTRIVKRVRNYLNRLKNSQLARQIAKIVIGAIGVTSSIIAIYLFLVDAHPPQVSDLKCEGFSENSVVQVARPFFSWTFNDEDRGSHQDSVYIRVGTRAGDTSLWDYCFAGSQNQIRYAGKILANNKTYHWSIAVVDDDGFHSQFQYSIFKTTWQEQPIREMISIQNRDKMDTYILEQYLRNTIKLSRTYQNAHAGESCLYDLEFKESRSSVFRLDITFQSIGDTSAITFSDSIATVAAENALWSLLENAYKQLKSQLDNYYRSPLALKGCQ